MARSNLKRSLAYTGSILALAGAVQFVQPVTPAQAQNECSAVHILAAQGTGGSGSGKNPNEMPNFAEGKIALQMAEKFPGQVSYWNTPYPSSAGAVYSTTAKNGETTTYGHSRLIGAKAMVDQMESHKANCPNTKYLLTGFSQGASVAGDAAALIANGASSTVKGDDLMGAMLYSDPGRSGNSKYTGTTGQKGYMPLPPGAQYQRNGAYSNAGQKDGAVGWTGQRSLSFKGIEGKVISICNPSDLACSVADKGFLRAIADMSDKNWRPLPAEYDNKASIKKMLDSGKLIPLGFNLLGEGFITKVTNGDMTGMVRSLDKMAKNSNLNAADKATLDNAITEIRYAIKLLKSDLGYGSDVPESLMFAHMVKSAGKDAVANIPDGMVPEEFKPALDIAINVLTAKDTSAIPKDVADRMEKSFRYAVNFPREHMDYYGHDGKYRIGESSAEDWALGAVETGIRNVIDGKMISLDAGANPRDRDDAIEVSDPDRLSDGLEAIVDPEWSEDKPFDPRDYLDDDVDPNDILGAGGQGITNNSGTRGSDKPVDTPVTQDEGEGSNEYTGTFPELDKDDDDEEDKDEEDKVSEEEETTAPSSVTPASDGASIVGPTVDTGGKIKESLLSKVLGAFTR